MESNVLATVLTSSVVAGVISSLLDIYYIQNISMCRNTEKKCMHYENGIKDEKNI